MKTLNDIIKAYSERLSLNSEDVRTLFAATIESCYDGNEDAFIEDILSDFVVTAEGKADAFSYFDYMSSTTFA